MIKISFEKGSKDITGYIVPDQAQFGPKYFLAFKLPYFKLKILAHILEPKKKDVMILA